MIYNINNGFNILSFFVGWGLILVLIYNVLFGVEMWIFLMWFLFFVVVVIGRELLVLVFLLE